MKPDRRNSAARRLLTAMLAGVALLVGSGAGARDLPELLRLLRRAQTMEVRGEVRTDVFFPPREEPSRTVRTLPRVGFVPGLLSRNFSLTNVSEERVAGREALRFDLTPLNEAADRWTLWTDVEWEVPLAFEERRADGTLVKRATFTAVQGPPRRRVLPAPITRSGFRRAVLAALPGLRLPRGFEPLEVRTTARGQELTLSDGANVLVLVVAGRGVREADGVASRRVGDRFVWLIGTLPREALSAALAGVREVRLSELGTFGP